MTHELSADRYDAVLFDLDGVLTATAEAAGLLALFEARVDGVVAAERGLPGKPAPDTFLSAPADLDVTPDRDATPDRAVGVEDAISGVQAGRAGHFGLVVGVDEGNPAPLRDHGADVVVDDLGALVP